MECTIYTIYQFWWSQFWWLTDELSCTKYRPLAHGFTLRVMDPLSHKTVIYPDSMVASEESARRYLPSPPLVTSPQAMSRVRLRL